MTNVVFSDDLPDITPASDDRLLLSDTSAAGASSDAPLSALPISTATQTALDAKLDDSQLDIDGTLAANSDAKIPSQKAVKTYVDAQVASGVGTVTGVSVVSANWLAGTVATSTSTPAITLSTTVTGLLKGNGTAISAAVSWTDYEPAKWADDNYVTDAEKIVIGNTSGTNTWDQNLSSLVTWPASATDAVPVLFDGTTGKLVKNSTPTGTGNPVLATSPTLTSPALGVATATSINGATITSGTLNGSVTGTNTGNQTITNSSDATSHTVTLSASGGSVQLVEGSNITLTTTGTGAAWVVTIAATAGGTGDVVGPASSTDNAVARFDSTTGKLLQNSAVTIADTTGDITGGKYNTVAISGSATPTLAVTGTTTVSGTNTGDQTTISGNAGSATYASAVTVAADATAASFYPLFVSATTGNLAPKLDGNLTYNPSTNTLTTGTFVWALTGTASGNLVSGGALGTPSSGTLTNATGLPIAGLTASTSTALGVGSVELGHATDTSITRVSAGVIAVEGATVPTLTSTSTFATGVKTFLAGMFALRNVANTFSGFFTNTNTADRTYTLKDASGTLAFTSDITGTNSGTNTGDVTLAGTPNYITIAWQAITRALINLTTHVTGTLPIANGGTNSAATPATSAAMVFSGTSMVGSHVSITDGNDTMSGKSLVLAGTAAKTETVELWVASTRNWAIKLNNVSNANATTVVTWVPGSAITVTLPASTGTVALTSQITGTNSGTNTGDQTSIVGITGTIAQFNTAVTDADLATIAGTETLTNKTLTSPTLTTPALGTPTSGNLSNCTADGTNGVGYKNIPQNSKSAAYTTVLGDAGYHIYHPSADTTARTFTIDSNANVAYPIGTAITFINDTSAGVVTIAITSDTLVLAGAGTTGSRTLAANWMATAVKVTSTRWIISGTWLT